MVMSERRVRDDQRLHGRGVAFHDVGHAGIGIDDDLIGEAHETLAVNRIMRGEMFSERPMAIQQRHSGRRIGVEHLLCRDDLDLVRIDVEAEIIDRHCLDSVVDALDRREIPVRALEQAARRVAVRHDVPCSTGSLRRRKRSRKTG